MQSIRNAFQQIASQMPSGSGGGGGSLMTVAGLAGAAYAGYNSFFTVEGGHRAVVWNRFTGIREAAVAEGMHFRIPLVEYPYIYDVRTRPRNIQSLTGSKDLQMVHITLRVLTRPEVDSLPWIYRRLGMDFDDRVLPSIVNEVTKAVVANYNASELLTRREEVSKEIAFELRKRSSAFRIVMEDVSITHLGFSRQYEAAVERKQVAQQESERARFVVQKALQEKQAIVIRAQGTAQSSKLIGESVKENPGFVQLRRLETAREIADVVTQSQNKVYLNSDSLLLNMIVADTDKGGKKK